MADGANIGVSVPKAPRGGQYELELTELVKKLEEAVQKKKQGKFFARKTQFALANSRDGYSVVSWKFNDWDYKRRDLPTYARGLFTTWDADGVPQIAVRGYDKFFNVNEVNETQWECIQAQTQGPYELTLKENGCIIFIAGLADDTLLVCSKHSTGDRTDVQVSHSSAGEMRLAAQLERLGKTKAELAHELYVRNITAVAELCDDSFEEHILAYGPDRAGLYLHGINHNVPEFATYQSILVQDFARHWGFREVGLIVLNDAAKVRQFLEGVAESGAHDGRDVEGFVVRCRRSPKPGVMPYRDWFFKFKFEEPYLMYRQWRECTKALIAGRAPLVKKHKEITQEYLLYARKRLAADPTLSKLYNQNHGIIQLRDDFLRSRHMSGAEAANIDVQHGGGEVTRDIILVPIATLGCGKTTVALALAKLFDFGHVQNDNVMGTRRPPRFTRMVLDELKTHPAVVADRNNALRQERKQILMDAHVQHANVKMVALNFVHDSIDKVRAVTHERVFARGDNHQTIHAASEGDKVVGIMEGFLRRFEPCDTERAPDDGFDAVIDLSPTAGSRENLETVVRELHRLYPKLLPVIPSAETMDAAVAEAIGDYNPLLQHKLVDHSMNRGKKQQPLTPKKAVKMKPLEYMAVHVAAKDINAELERTFAGRSQAETQFYRQLVQKRRVQGAFHVTLMHRANAKQNAALWDRYVRVHTEAQAAAATTDAITDAAVNATPELAQVDVQLERVVFDDRLMAIVVRLVDKTASSGVVAAGEGWVCANRVSHITVGTRDDRVKPKDSNDLLERWLNEDGTTTSGITALVMEGQPLVAGVVRGVLAR